jgi:hypothetical protein
MKTLKTVIGELQTEQKILSTNKGVTPEKLEEAALKSVRKMIAKRVRTYPPRLGPQN